MLEQSKNEIRKKIQEINSDAALFSEDRGVRESTFPSYIPLEPIFRFELVWKRYCEMFQVQRKNKNN